MSARALVAMAFGAAIASGATVTVEPQRRPSYAADIAPILNANCVSCHRSDQRASFPLTSYDAAAARGKEIADAVTARRMPPWLPSPPRGFPAVRGDRRLTERQVSAVRSWVEAGMPAGDLRRAPLPPPFAAGWALGVPDLTMSMPRVLPLPASDEPRIFNVVVPLALPDDRWITAIDYQPTSSAVHHAIFFFIPPDLTVGDADALPGFAGLLGGGPLRRPGADIVRVDGSIEPAGVWTAGMTPTAAPAGTGYRLRRGWNLVVQLHADASDTGDFEDGRLAVYFSSRPPARSLMAVQVPPAFGYGAGLDIPAGTPRFVFRDAFVLPVDVEVMGARGHAHRRGRELTLTAALPNGSTRGVLRIDRWDPRWQDTYYFDAPVRLPKGSTVHAELTYDNSTGPDGRPGTAASISWGPRLSQEIGSLALIIAAPSGLDADLLADARTKHFRDVLTRGVR